MNPYEYIVLVCGNDGSSDSSQAFDDADLAFDYAEVVRNDHYVLSATVIRVERGRWPGKQPGQCNISTVNMN